MQSTNDMNADLMQSIKDMNADLTQMLTALLADRLLADSQALLVESQVALTTSQAAITENLKSDNVDRDKDSDVAAKTAHTASNTATNDVAAASAIHEIVKDARKMRAEFIIQHPANAAAAKVEREESVAKQKSDHEKASADRAKIKAEREEFAAKQKADDKYAAKWLAEREERAAQREAEREREESAAKQKADENYAAKWLAERDERAAQREAERKSLPTSIDPPKEMKTNIYDSQLSIDYAILHCPFHTLKQMAHSVFQIIVDHPWDKLSRDEQDRHNDRLADQVEAIQRGTLAPQFTHAQLAWLRKRKAWKMYDAALANNLCHEVAEGRCSMKNQCHTKYDYAAEDDVSGSYECDSNPRQQPWHSEYTNNGLNGSMTMAVNTKRMSIQFTTDDIENPLRIESSGRDDASVPSSRHEYQKDEGIDNSFKGDYNAQDSYQGRNNYQGNNGYRDYNNPYDHGDDGYGRAMTTTATKMAM